MERRNLALLCAGVVCFWLFALAFGTAQGKGLRIQPAVQTQAEPAVQTLTVTPPQLTLPCARQSSSTRPAARCFTR